MFLDVLVLLVGFGMLIYGSDVFVGASADIARRLGVPGIIVGLTIVAMGTSAPEAAISAMASLRGSNALAVGNVVGSNIFNLLLILGVCGLAYPFGLRLAGISRDLWVVSISTAALLGLVFMGGAHINRGSAVLFLIVFAIYVGIVIIDGLKSKDTYESEPSQEEGRGKGKNILLLVVGCGLMLGGGQLAVVSATGIAEAIGITERVIGITVLAVGTSLPELVTCVVACRTGRSDIALGNIIGSSVFNILFVLGLSGVISPVPISPDLVYDLIVLAAATVLSTIALVSGQRLSRPEGLFLLTAYVAYTISLIYGG